jgi:hypothetical protein
VNILRRKDQAEMMNYLPVTLTEPMLVVIAPQAGRKVMLDLAAQIAASRSLRVLDGGNQFNVYPVARAIRRYTQDLTAALRRIHISRAFTCYQMTAMLEEDHTGEGIILALDLLATFYDENVKILESQRLLNICIKRLQDLSRYTTVIVSARPPAAPVAQERTPLLEQLRRATNQIWETYELSSPEQENINGTNLTFNYPGLS